MQEERKGLLGWLFGGLRKGRRRTAKKQGNPTKSRRLTLESLESRQLLSAAGLGGSHVDQVLAADPLSISISPSTYAFYPPDSQEIQVNGYQGGMRNPNVYADVSDVSDGLVKLSGKVTGATPGSIVELVVNWRDGSNTSRDDSETFSVVDDTPFTVSHDYEHIDGVTEDFEVDCTATSSDNQTTDATVPIKVADPGPVQNEDFEDFNGGNSGGKVTMYTNEPGSLHNFTFDWKAYYIPDGGGPDLVKSQTDREKQPPDSFEIPLRYEEGTWDLDWNEVTSDEYGLTCSNGVSGEYRSFSPDTPTFSITETDPGPVPEGLPAHFEVSVPIGEAADCATYHTVPL